MELDKQFSSQATVVPGAETKKFLQDGIGFVELLECFGSDLTVVNAARVSMNKEASFEATGLAARDQQLIKYLAANRHITPFFHPQVRFRIKMPIFVAREWWRSTIGFSRNEVSRRYVSDEPQCFVPEQLRQRDKNIKQGSKDCSIDGNETAVNEMKNYVADAVAYYNRLLAMGVCPEQARMILPQSMYTEFIETASLAGYARLAVLRLDRSAQKEIRDYAAGMSGFMEKLFPVSWPALLEAGEKSAL